MEFLQLRQHGGVIARRNGFGADDPGIKLGVGRFDQPLEIVEPGIVELVDMGVGETADDEIRLAHAAPPGAEQSLRRRSSNPSLDRSVMVPC